MLSATEYLWVSAGPDTMSYGSMGTVEEAGGKETRVEEVEKVLDYDALVGTIGEFGWFQRLACALLWVPAAIGGVHVLMYSFTGQYQVTGITDIAFLDSKIKRMFNPLRCPKKVCQITILFVENRLV